MWKEGEPLVNEVTIEIYPERLSWPSVGEAQEESCLGGNRQYFDIRRTPWRDVAEMISKEEKLLQRVRASTDVTQAAQTIADEIEEELDAGDFHPLWGFDLGVSAATLALAAAGCVTYSSCNGGVFGENRHNERYPLIAFYMRRRIAGVVCIAAKQANAGLLMHADGSLQVYADDPWTLHVFASEVYTRRALIRSANRSAV